MTKKEIERVKKNMGEIEFYQYFYWDANESYIKEYINQLRESEKLYNIIYESLKNNKDYNIMLFEGSITIENKKTKDCYHLTIEI